MMTTEEIKSELKTKERSVADLLRFITTRSDDTISNYNLLLGSGCSVTSGINSGGQLIEQWRKEVYENLDENKDKEYSQEKAIDFLSKNHGGWYNRNNEYSSLFEKKYDLARQRRMFVEQEVKDKTPSIGYAYLVNLIKVSYFNTIFTTNFDDLINEAFYQFSDTRPMVCAHDSSINSITVTSKRPKIIKLHGDYLFDDIKTTLRETESLEENIRNKFIEFAKDFGLIVVGYSGSDRSIMDVLTFLLKHEDYYKGGIYWCLRKGDIIGEDLRKLLWKDKVYFIEIDGFDELFAHLHHKIYKDNLPIDTNFISNKSQDIIHKFVTNPHLRKSGSEIIQEDLKNLKYQSERNNIYDLIKQMQSDKDLSDGKLENRELVLIFKVTNLLKEHQYKEALELSEESLKNTSNKHLKVELLKKIVTAHARLENQNEAKKANDKLIEIEPNNPIHLLKRFDLEKLFEDKLKWINKAIELDSYNSDLYNEKISILINNYDSTIDNNESGLLEITDLLNKSIEINPSINNSSWNLKFDFLKENKYKDYKDELDNIINELSKQDPYSISVLEMKYSLITDDNTRKSFLEEIKIAKKKYLHENKLAYELFFLNVLDDINDKNKIEENLKNLSSNDLYNKDHAFLREKANLLFKKFDKLSESILVLEESLKIKKSNKSILQLIEYLIYSENLDKAKSVYEKYKFSLSDIEKVGTEKNFYDAEKNYNAAYNKLKYLQSLSSYKDKHLSNLSYYLLKQKKFQEAKDLLAQYLKERSFNRSLESELINYELACMKTGQKIDKTRLGELESSTNSDLVKAAIYALEEQNDKVFNSLDKVLEKDARQKYIFKDWPVFAPLTENPRYKKYFDAKI